MKSKHTPGPWGRTDAGVVVDSTARALFYPAPGGCNRRSDGMLAAASPKLLDACKALIETDNLQNAIDLAREALALVRGES